MEKNRNLNESVLFADLDLRVPLSGRTARKQTQTRTMNPLKWFVIIVLSGIFTGGVSTVIWYSYMQGYDEASAEHAPEITADDTPLKVKPETPGGLNVPHQNRMVYEVMKGGKINHQVEHLLPMPEQPVQRDMPEPVVVETPQLDVTDSHEDELSPEIEAPQPELMARDIDKSFAELVEKPLKTELEEKPVEAKPVQTVVAAPAEVTKPKAPQKKAKIVLGTMRTITAADREAARINSQFKSILGKAKVSVVPYRKNDQTMFRIMTGSLDLDQVEKIQQQLKNSKLNLIILR